MNRLSQGGFVVVAALSLEGKDMDPICSYFRENLGKVTKEQLLEALENALRSAEYWRRACLYWPSNVNTPVMNPPTSKEYNNV